MKVRKGSCSGLRWFAGGEDNEVGTSGYKWGKSLELTLFLPFLCPVGIEELFLQITRKLVEKKQEIERINRQNAENAITLQQLEDERLQQAQATNNSSVCCGI